MKTRLVASVVLPLALLVARAPALADDACCEANLAEVVATPAAAAGHPLRGVIVAVLAEKQALLVKHEAIPGVMAAMTMLMKVDAAVLPTVTKDQKISATVIRKDDGWWLENIKPLADDPA